MRMSEVAGFPPLTRRRPRFWLSPQARLGTLINRLLLLPKMAMGIFQCCRNLCCHPLLSSCKESPYFPSFLRSKTPRTSLALFLSPCLFRPFFAFPLPLAPFPSSSSSSIPPFHSESLTLPPSSPSSSPNLELPNHAQPQKMTRIRRAKRVQNLRTLVSIRPLPAEQGKADRATLRGRSSAPQSSSSDWCLDRNNGMFQRSRRCSELLV